MLFSPYSICLQNSSLLQRYQVLVSLSHPTTNFHSFFAKSALKSTDTSYPFLQWINIIKPGAIFPAYFPAKFKICSFWKRAYATKRQPVIFHLYQFGLMKDITSSQQPIPLSRAYLKGENCLPSKKHSWQVIFPDCLRYLWRLFVGS